MATSPLRWQFRGGKLIFAPAHSSIPDQAADRLELGFFCLGADVLHNQSKALVADTSQLLLSAIKHLQVGFKGEQPVTALAGNLPQDVVLAHKGHQLVGRTIVDAADGRGPVDANEHSAQYLR